MKVTVHFINSTCVEFEIDDEVIDDLRELMLEDYSDPIVGFSHDSQEVLVNRTLMTHVEITNE